MQKKNGMEERAQFRNKWKNPFCVNCSWNNPAIWILWAICSWNTHAACILWAVLFISLIYSWIARNTGWDVGDLLVVKMSTFPMWVTGFQSCLHHQFQCPADMDLGQMMAQVVGSLPPTQKAWIAFWSSDSDLADPGFCRQVRNESGDGTKPRYSNVAHGLRNRHFNCKRAIPASCFRLQLWDSMYQYSVYEIYAF